VIHQMDVKITLLNGDLEEEIYMEQPGGFIVPGQEHQVCKLENFLYGLKQAHIQWHKKFDQVVLYHSFVINDSDKCVYRKSIRNDHVIMCLYVDDILIFGTSMNVTNEKI